MTDSVKKPASPPRPVSAPEPTLVRSLGHNTLSALQERAKEVGYPHALIASPADALLGKDAFEAGAVPLEERPALSLEELHRSGHKVVPWTVNDPARMQALMRAGVDGLISDSPDVLRRVVEGYDADGDGRGGDLLDKDGLIDRSRFDAEAHRGGRNLRPENTLPSMEVGLDSLCNTLETDAAITADGVPVLSHNPRVHADCARRADGGSYGVADEIRIKDLMLEELQSRFILDKTLADRPQQRNDRALSPAAVAYARARDLADPYVMPSVAQLFDFISFYAEYYRSGEGRSQPDATRRWKNAERVHVNLETKVTAQTEAAGEVIPVEPFTRIVAEAILKAGMQNRVTLQSFDPASIALVEARYPELQGVFLFEQ